MAKKLFIILSLIISLGAFAEESALGVPSEDCNCGPTSSNTLDVIQAMSKTDVVVPIILKYGFVKLGKADLEITHVDGKITSAKINGSVNAFGFKDSMVETIDLDQLKKGTPIRYFSNDEEAPVCEVVSKSISEKGGTVILKVKMKDSIENIPLDIFWNGQSFSARADGKTINSLIISFGFDLAKSTQQQNVIGGHVAKYKIQ